MYTLISTPVQTSKQWMQYTPQYSSPLSSSPQRPSPLSPRNANCLNFNQVMTTPTKTPPPPIFTKEIFQAIQSSPSKRESIYSKRVAKANPLIHGRSSENDRETRRKLFLRRVKESSEEKKWQNRGGDDEMARTIWFGERRRWMERHARASETYIDLDDDMNEEEEFAIRMADEIALREEEELQAMLDLYDNSVLSSQDKPPSVNLNHPYQFSSQEMSQSEDDTALSSSKDVHIMDDTYGSDDDEYDRLFMDAFQADELSPEQNLEIDDEMMDMS